MEPVNWHIRLQLYRKSAIWKRQKWSCVKNVQWFIYTEEWIRGYLELRITRRQFFFVLVLSFGLNFINTRLYLAIYSTVMFLFIFTALIKLSKTVWFIFGNRNFFYWTMSDFKRQHESEYSWYLSKTDKNEHMICCISLLSCRLCNNLSFPLSVFIHPWL